MSIRPRLTLVTLALPLALPLTAARAGAQADAAAAIAAVRAELPGDVADRVVARAAAAESDGMAGAALLERALRFAQRGIAPVAIADAIDAHAARMALVRTALHDAGAPAAADAIDAGAELLRRGVGTDVVADLAHRSPDAALPLTVLGALLDRGVPVDQGLAMVQARLATPEGAASLASLPDEAGARAQPARALPPGLAIAARHRAAANGGRPASLPMGGVGRGRAGVPGGGRGGRP